MAIEIEDYWLIKEFCKRYQISGKILILGDCYYHFNHNDIKIEKKDNIQNDVFVNTLGFHSVDTIDIEGNPTFKQDLADKLPENFRNKYDFIIDAGTLCCCFDVPSVLRNLQFLLKENGYILHVSYFSGFFGRGYYSFQPNFFQDYYKINNYDLKYIGIRKKNKYSGLFRKVFSNKYSWKSMEKDFSYFNGKNLCREYESDPLKIDNNMIICALVKKQKNAIVKIPTPTLIKEEA